MPDQMDRFVSSLKSSNHKIQIAFMEGDPESHFLELQFGQAVHLAGWEYGSWEVHLNGVILFGLSVLGESTQADAKRSLMQALSAAE